MTIKHTEDLPDPHQEIHGTRPSAKQVAKVAAARELLDCVFYALRDGRVRRLGHTGAA